MRLAQKSNVHWLRLWSLHMRPSVRVVFHYLQVVRCGSSVEVAQTIPVPVPSPGVCLSL